VLGMSALNLVVVRRRVRYPFVRRLLKTVTLILSPQSPRQSQSGSLPLARELKADPHQL
jgi:hypothetical protein